MEDVTIYSERPAPLALQEDDGVWELQQVQALNTLEHQVLDTPEPKEEPLPVIMEQNAEPQKEVPTLTLTPRSANQPINNFSRRPLKKPITLEFENLKYVVPLGLRRGTKKILKNISGSFQASQLIAIMGPSGAGKSSLLDILTGYKVTGVKGNILVNRKPRELAKFRRDSCYIMQDDLLEPLLTVAENMTVAAHLKLGPDVPEKEKKFTVEEILRTLSLEEHIKTRAERLSGGQRKRLSIALELINNPLVMFLDEPTTGLDSSSCSQTMQLLRSLALQGRTIICTIHQPSATLFALFHHVYVLAEGRCVYQGATEKLVPFLEHIGRPCPEYNNPADYVIELTCGDAEDGSNEEAVRSMVDGSENGRCIRWFRNPDPLLVSISRVNLHDGGDNGNTKRCRKGIKGIFTKSKHRSTPSTPSSTSQVRDDTYDDLASNDVVPTGPMRRLLALCGAGQPADHVAQETSQWNQLKVLMQRGYIKTKRDQTLTHARIITQIIVGVLLGVLFWQCGNDGDRVIENYNLLFSILVHHMISTMMLTVLTFPLQMSILMKEHFNRWYSLKAYYLSITLWELPVVTVGCVIFTVIVYLMTDQPMDWYRFSMFLLISLLVTYAAQSVGLVIGAIFNVVNGTFIGPVISVPMMMFAGFGVTLRDIPVYMIPGTYVSYLRFGLEGLVLTLYADRERLPCGERYCHYRYPEKLLYEIAMDESVMYIDIIGLILILLLLRITAFYCLRWRIKSQR